MRYNFISLFIIFALIVPKAVQADREIPDDNLAYPVLISLSTGSNGSGFFLNNNDSIYLITASHVLFDETSGDLKSNQAKLLSYSCDPKETQRNIIQLDLKMLFESNRIKKHSSEDVTAIYIADAKVKEGETGEKSLNVVPGVIIIEHAPSGILWGSSENLKSFKDVLTANTIYVFGYPTSIGMKEIPQIDPLRPILRFGIVAGTNPERKTIILDCPSYPGNSGGPVLEVEHFGLAERRFRVIGVVSQFIPFAETWVNVTHKYKNLTISNSGYTIAVSMDPVIELTSKP
ncbi:MAG: serine protease [Desulfobulbaceae bacterium]|nr:serine protease [Desulfobulbaceae bacterium]